MKKNRTVFRGIEIAEDPSGSLAVTTMDVFHITTRRKRRLIESNPVANPGSGAERINISPLMKILFPLSFFFALFGFIFFINFFKPPPPSNTQLQLLTQYKDHRDIEYYSTSLKNRIPSWTLPQSHI